MRCAFRRVVGLKVMVVYNQGLFLINAGITGCSLPPCKRTVTYITLVMQCIREPSAQSPITWEAEQREEWECLYPLRPAFGQAPLFPHLPPQNVHRVARGEGAPL